MYSRPKTIDFPRSIRGVLGPLERQVMEILWREKQCSVRDVVDQLPRKRAYTTVMTTLSRLFTRGLLNRTGVARKFLYSPSVDQIQLDYMLAQRVLSVLLEIQENSQAPELVSLYILKRLFQHDPDVFDAMVDIVRSNKKSLQSNVGGANDGGTRT